MRSSVSSKGILLLTCIPSVGATRSRSPNAPPLLGRAKAASMTEMVCALMYRPLAVNFVENAGYFVVYTVFIIKGLKAKRVFSAYAEYL